MNERSNVATFVPAVIVAVLSDLVGICNQRAIEKPQCSATPHNADKRFQLYVLSEMAGGY